MKNVTKTLKKLCKIVEGIKDQSKRLLDIQEQTGSAYVEYVKAQENMRDGAKNILKIMEKILGKSEKND